MYAFPLIYSWHLRSCTVKEKANDYCQIVHILQNNTAIILQVFLVLYAKYFSFSTFWAHLAVDKLTIFLLFFLEKRFDFLYKTGD